MLCVTSHVGCGMLKSLQLGSLSLPTNLIQGPLAGYSCAPFRKLIHEFGGVGYATTEMLSAYELAHDVEQPLRYTYRDPGEGLLCYQISGNNCSDLSYATEKVVKSGADLVDLNCGCPQRKIRKKDMDPNCWVILKRCIDCLVRCVLQLMCQCQPKSELTVIVGSALIVKWLMRLNLLVWIL